MFFFIFNFSVLGNESSPNFSWELVAMAHNVTSRLFPLFYELLKENGWNMNITQFGADEWRLEWQNEAMNMKFL